MGLVGITYRGIDSLFAQFDNSIKTLMITLIFSILKETPHDNVSAISPYSLEYVLAYVNVL